MRVGMTKGELGDTQARFWWAGGQVRPCHRRAMSDCRGASVGDKQQ
jgi:hypothetical protein